IAMLGQLHGVTAAGDDVAEDPQPGEAGDVADHQRQLQIHLYQGFLHAQDVHAGTLDKRLTMAEIRTQGHERLDWPKTPSGQPDAVQVPEPLAIRDVALAARHVFEMAGIDEEHVKAARFEDLKHRDPVHAVDSIATLVTPQAASQSARRISSVVKVLNDWTGLGSRSGGTAT